MVTELLTALGELGKLVDVPMNGSIKKENVAKIAAMSSEAIRACINAAK